MAYLTDDAPRSADGAWWWDGARWQPVPDWQPAAVPTAAPPRPTGRYDTGIDLTDGALAARAGAERASSERATSARAPAERATAAPKGYLQGGTVGSRAAPPTARRARGGFLTGRGIAWTLVLAVAVAVAVGGITVNGGLFVEHAAGSNLDRFTQVLTTSEQDLYRVANRFGTTEELQAAGYAVPEFGDVDGATYYFPTDGGVCFDVTGSGGTLSVHLGRTAQKVAITGSCATAYSGLAGAR